MKAINSIDLKIPLVIGMSGHLDIPKESIKYIEFKVIAIFDNLIKKYPKTPLVLLSPLADGADRIVANIILEEYKDKVSVFVPLPMDIDVYKDTFGKGATLLTPKESKAEFDELLEKVNAQTDIYMPKTIPMIFDRTRYNELVKNKDNESEDDKKERRKPYAIVGEYIALHSHILLAVYNENSKLINGGTQEVVQKKLSGKYEYMNVVNEDITYKEQGLVYAISTPRIKKEDDVREPEIPYQITKLFPNGKKEIGLNETNNHTSLIEKMKNHLIGKNCILFQKNNSFSIQHQNIECFNYDVEKNSEKILEIIKEDIKVTEDNLLKKNIIMRRSAAYLADKVYKPMQETKAKYILLFISLIVFAIALKTNVSDFSFNIYIDSIYILLLIPLYLLNLKFKHTKKKQEDYRSLAEGLRVQIAWNMAEVDESVALYYLSHQRSELDWIRSAIRCINIFYIPTPNDECTNSKLVKEHWIGKQIDYFYKNIPKEEQKEHKNNLLLKIFFRIFLLGSAMFFILNFYPEVNDNMEHYIWNLTLLDILQILLIVFPITISTYLQSKQLFDGNDEKLREYKLSLDIFTNAQNMIDDKDKRYNIQNTIRNLGIEALRENSSWIIIRRSKEYNTPAN